MVTKTDYETKINKLEKKITDHNHDRYITTPEFIKLTVENIAARIVQVKSITKTDLDAKLSNLYRKITWNKTKHLFVENQLKKLETFDSVYFPG